MSPAPWQVESMEVQSSSITTPMEVIQNVFLRGKRPMAAPISQRGFFVQAPSRPESAGLGLELRKQQEEEPELTPCGPAEEQTGRASGASLAVEEQPPAKRARAAAEDTAAEAAARDARGVEELSRAMFDAPAWRSVLGCRARLGQVGTIGEWLRAQGEDL
eukprot:CAMPEP_0171090610 /NCGR_PEP_ID=MMETSP0766_2-20121228/31965_1 /TAXON_ID=439317 /ORGANISM="Gambierdiscus australes, Strain CAWD 149" /LENGTH=160 /DNA_ID=CAMNT_0011548623 /DNA_START=55 /DNA_END=537 /DNA_ORIENTATION=-